MFKKRILSVVVVTTLALSTFLVGCGKTEDKGAVNAQSTAQATKEAQPASIKYLTYDGAKINNEYIVQLEINAFMKKYPNIKVSLDMQSENNSTEFLKKLDIMLLSGDTSDVIQTPSYRDYADRAIKGSFAALDDSIKAEGKTYDSMYTFPSKINDKIYGIPYNPGIYHVLINKSMLDAAGLPVPKADWTWDDYKTYAQKMTKGTGKDKVYGSYMHTWTEYRRSSLFDTKMDNPYVKDDGSSNLGDPVFKDWLKFIKDMETVDKSQLSYSDAKSTNMAYRDVFFKGQAAMVLTGSWMYDDIKNIQKYPHDFVTVFAAYPRWKDSPVGRTEGSCSYHSVNKNTKSIDAAYKFATFLSGEGAASVNNLPALKGTDYTKVINAKVGDSAKLFDMNSLLAIWNNPSLQPNMITTFPDTFKALDDMYNLETEKYMVGASDLDTTINTVIAKSKEILKK